MIYNRKTVATLIKQNVAILNKKITEYQPELYTEEYPNKEFDYLVAWREKNITTLWDLGHISDEEMEKYMKTDDWSFIPEITI